MHANPNVKVERRAFLDPVGGSSKREIDALLTSNVGGYLVRVAIECKNEKKPIGSPKIDAFVGKLEDVGIPSQLGIYVSASGYTGGAIETARKAGIRTLILTGLTRDRLSAAVAKAFQSVVRAPLPEEARHEARGGLARIATGGARKAYRSYDARVTGHLIRTWSKAQVSYLKHFPKPLLDDLVKNRWIPIVGAGFSLNAVAPKGQTVPLWEDLGKALAKDLGDYSYSAALDAISAYSHEYSRAKLVERLFELLLIDKVSPGEAHRAFCSVQFDIVCTTNFDFLLDRQYEQSPRYCLPILDEDQLSVNALSVGNRDARRDDLTVALLKLHGDLHHPQRLVVTEEDYDLFLQRYPLLATQLSSLLIGRTAVLVGYSLNDYDFRQVWQVVGERLGKLRRPAYSLAVNPRPAEVAGFERRGVKVIRLPGTKSKYPEILAKTFDELREYWTSNVISVSHVTEEETLQELSLPRDAATRLCFFSIPLRLYSFYRDRVFPLARRYGFVPVTAQDVVSPGDSVVAVVEELAKRASTAVLDMGNGNSATEARLALSVRNFVGVVVVTEHRAGDALDVLLPPHRSDHFTGESSDFPPSVRRLVRPVEPFDKAGPFLDVMEGWFRSLSADLGPRREEEPVRLLRAGEHKAAVISAMTQLEVALRERLGRDLERHGYLKGLGRMLEPAERYEVLDTRTVERVRSWSELRNAVVHTMRSVDPDTANEVVYGALEVIERLRGHGH